MKKVFLTFILGIITITLSASDFTVDNIAYNITSDSTVGVASKSNPSYSGDITIPSFVIYGGKTYKVTSILTVAFMQCNLTSISIPNSIDSIYYGAFAASSLTSIIIPNSVTYIDGYEFFDCTSLTSVTLPDNITSISDGLFSNCPKLTSITIPDNVTYIGINAFYGCSSLTSITIPENVESIEESAFSNCSGITSITIPNKVEYIKKYAFQDCTNLTSVTINNPTFTSIASNAFDGCTNLKNNPITTSSKNQQLFISNIKVYTQNNEIIIDNAKDKNISIYNINGELIYQGNGNNTINAISGIYIIKSDNKSIKLLVK